MNKSLPLALLAAGIMLTIFGVNEMNSFASDISRLFTGVPSDRAVWMLIGGVVLVVLGLASLLRPSSERR